MNLPTWRKIHSKLTGLSVKRKLSAILQVGALGFTFFTIIVAGRPPALAQRHPVVVEGVVSNKDDTQDMILNTLTIQHDIEFKNQQDWNKQTGVQLGVMDVRIHDVESRIWMFIGGTLVVSALVGGSVIVTLRGK